MKIQETYRRLILASVFCIGLGIIFRTPSDLQDGLSLRAAEVGYWSWHLAGWGARDLWQGILIFYISVRALLRTPIIGKSAVLYIVTNLAISFLISIWWHNFVYNWTLENLKYFGW